MHFLVVSPASGSGAGVSIATPFTPETPRVCATPPSYWRYTYATVVTITNSTMRGNVCKNSTDRTRSGSTGPGTGGSGGGINLAGDASVHLDAVTLIGNEASYGGGGMFGGIGARTPSSCRLVVSGGTVLANNTATHSGDQLYSGCTGDVVVVNTTVNMLTGTSQV